MKLLIVTVATCLALQSTCSQAGRVRQAGSVSNGAMDGGLSLEDLQHLLEIKTNLTRVQRSEIQVLQRQQQHHMELNKEKNDQLAAKDAIIDLYIAENAKLSSELEGEQSKISNPGCNVGEMYDNNCYLVISTPTSWQDAQLDCTNRNMSLASIHNAGTNDFIANLTGGGNSRTWIGASDAETEGVWKWTNGDVCKFDNWNERQPDNARGDQSCLVINYRETGKWDDYWCGRQLPYVCQGQTVEETQELSNLSSISSELQGEQNEVSNPGCDVGEMYNGNCYLLVSTPATWQDAQLDCTNRNGSLATIDNAGTNDFIGNLAGGGDWRTWIGASDAETEGVWKWTNGNVAKFYDWDRGQPNNWGGNQNCLEINHLETGKWQDNGCHALRPYVCQGKKLSKVCKSDWQQHGDKCYKVFPEVIRKYFDAGRKCSSEEAHVAAVETREENEFVKLLLEQEQLPFGRDLWLSGRRQSEDSPYVWGTGEEMAYNDWQGGHPHRRSDFCMQIFKDDNPTWQWHTTGCTNDDNGVLCEKTAY